MIHVCFICLLFCTNSWNLFSVSLFWYNFTLSFHFFTGQKCELWLCGPNFTLADICLGATLHRLKFLGLSKKYWEDGSRANIQSFFERVQKRYAFRKVLGDVHTTLLSAVLPNAFRMVKKKPPSFFGASFLMGSLGGMGYFAYWFLKKKYM